MRPNETLGSRHVMWEKLGGGEGGYVYERVREYKERIWEILIYATLCKVLS